MDMQQKCCNNNTRSLPASPDTVLPTFIPSHPPPDRPTNQQRTASRCPKENPPDQTSSSSSSSSTYPSHREPMQDPPIASVRYLPDFSPSDTRDLPDLTLPYLTFLGSHPKNKTSSDPSIREDRSRRHQLTISKKKLPEKLYYLLPEGS